MSATVAEVHTPEAHAVIAVEIGECILGQRRWWQR